MGKLCEIVFQESIYKFYGYTMNLTLEIINRHVTTWMSNDVEIPTVGSNVSHQLLF